MQCTRCMIKINLFRKKCSKCKRYKFFVEFSILKTSKDKHHAHCKNCRNTYRKEYYIKNKEKENKRNKKYHTINREIRLNQMHEWYQKNKSSKLEYNKQWGKSNKNLVAKYYKKWQLKNKIKLNEYNKQYTLEKRKNDYMFKLNGNISSQIYKCLKGYKNNKKWENFVDYTLSKLVQRIECQFKKGMSWENYGKWHIDHKKPKSLFKFEQKDNKDFRNCWLLCNLQPLWAKDNKTKGDRFNGV